MPFQGKAMAKWKDTLRKVYEQDKVTGEKMIKLIEAAAGRKGYFQIHFNEHSKLSRGAKFFGTLHCEACITSLAHLAHVSNSSSDADISAEFSVSLTARFVPFLP